MIPVVVSFSYYYYYYNYYHCNYHDSFYSYKYCQVYHYPPSRYCNVSSTSTAVATTTAVVSYWHYLY